MKRGLLALMVLVCVVLVGVPMQSGLAAGRPVCLVSNERTGVGYRSLAEAIATASAGDTLVVKGPAKGTTSASTRTCA